MDAVDILIADDHSLIRAGIRLLIEKMHGVRVVGEASDGREAVELAHKHQPDIVLTDIAMPGLNGLGLLNRLKIQAKPPRVIVLSMHTNEEYVREALMGGADGYIIKGADPTELRLAINAVQRGELFLSPGISKAVIQQFLHHQSPDTVKTLTSRQTEILQLVAEGKTTKDIARALHLSVKTIESHRTEIMNRLGIHEVTGLVRYAIRQGIVSSDT